MPAPDFTPTNFRQPRTGEAKLIIEFRGGYVDRKNSYRADQMRWTDTASDWDIVAWRLA